jgi:transposase
VNGLGLPTKIVLSPGPEADITHAPALLEGTPAAVVIADKGYDQRELVDGIEAKGGEAVIPTRKNSTAPRVIDTDRYKDRNRVERFWAKAKQYRRVATRYEKTARNFLAFVQVASIIILLR